MKSLLLERKPSTRTETEGFLLFDREVLVTLECPWVPSDMTPGGEPFESCVPAGVYRLIPHIRPSGHLAYAMINEDLGVYYLKQHAPKGVIVRYLCLLHVANYRYQIEGCTAPGLSKGASRYGPAVWQSSSAMERIRQYLGNDEAQLEIVRIK